VRERAVYRSARLFSFKPPLLHSLTSYAVDATRCDYTFVCLIRTLIHVLSLSLSLSFFLTTLSFATRLQSPSVVRVFRLKKEDWDSHTRQIRISFFLFMHSLLHDFRACLQTSHLGRWWCLSPSNWPASHRQFLLMRLDCCVFVCYCCCCCCCCLLFVFQMKKSLSTPRVTKAVISSA
jgi:hypothetical protein